MRGSLTAASVHTELPRKLYIWKHSRCGFDTCAQCVPGRDWWITETPTGRIITKCRTWAEALGTAETILSAARVPEVCS